MPPQDYLPLPLGEVLECPEYLLPEDDLVLGSGRGQVLKAGRGIPATDHAVPAVPIADHAGRGGEQVGAPGPGGERLKGRPVAAAGDEGVLDRVMGGAQVQAGEAAEPGYGPRVGVTVERGELFAELGTGPGLRPALGLGLGVGLGDGERGALELLEADMQPAASVRAFQDRPGRLDALPRRAALYIGDSSQRDARQPRCGSDGPEGMEPRHSDYIV